MKRNLGFTLVELIIAMSITTLLGLLMTDVLIQTLRGESKAKIVSSVKQNGQVTLERLVNLIRQGDEILCVGDGYAGKDTLVVFKQGEYFRFRFTAPDLGVTPAKNGFIVYDKFTADDYVNISSARCEDQDLIASKLSNLTDIDPVNGVSLSFANDPQYTESIFKRDTLAGFKDALTIKFRISAGVGAGSTYEATVKDGGILFNTTVGIRNMR
jgi:prepilin-type N-terminal cleavage/methylation domain-containing protein